MVKALHYVAFYDAFYEKTELSVIVDFFLGPRLNERFFPTGKIK